MSSFDTKLTAKFREIVEDRIALMRDQIADGICLDFEEYKASLKYVKALYDSISLMEQLRDELAKGEE